MLLAPFQKAAEGPTLEMATGWDLSKSLALDDDFDGEDNDHDGSWIMMDHDGS